MDEVVIEDARSVLERVLLENRSAFVRHLARRTRDPELAEEILQGAYVRALEGAAPEGSEEGIVPWFHAVLWNAWIDHLRRRRVETSALDRERREGLSDAIEPELQRAVCACLREMLSALKPEYADIIRQVDLDGVSIADAVKQAGITRNNANVRLHRARHALRRELIRACGACARHGCLDCTCGGMQVRLGYVDR